MNDPDRLFKVFFIDADDHIHFTEPNINHADIDACLCHQAKQLCGKADMPDDAFANHSNQGNAIFNEEIVW